MNYLVGAFYGFAVNVILVIYIEMYEKVTPPLGFEPDTANVCIFHAFAFFVHFIRKNVF